MKKYFKILYYVIPLFCIITLCKLLFLTRQSQNANFSNIDQLEFINKNKSSITTNKTELRQEYKYILKEFNGKLAVFKIDKKEPEMILDVSIDRLPEIDIEQLKIGLKIKNEKELNDRIEDFIS